MKRSQLLSLSFILASSFSMSLALATAKTAGASLPKKIQCQSIEKVEIKGKQIPEFEVQLTRIASEMGTVRLNRVRGHKQENSHHRVSLVQTDKTTRGYLPGFLIARNPQISLSVNIQESPFRASLWVPDLGERDGVLLRCK